MPDPEFDTGKLRNRVTLQKRTSPIPMAGLAGDEQVSWQDVGTYYAWVEPLSGRTLLNAQEIKATIDYRIWLRVRNDSTIQPLKNRIVYKGSMVFYPDSVTKFDQRNEYYQILCTYMQDEVP